MLVFRSAQEEEERKVVCFFADKWIYQEPHVRWVLNSTQEWGRPSHGGCVPWQPDRA
jgi:hypothetical protein